MGRCEKASMAAPMPLVTLITTTSVDGCAAPSDPVDGTSPATCKPSASSMAWRPARTEGSSATTRTRITPWEPDTDYAALGIALNLRDSPPRSTSNCTASPARSRFS